MFVDQSLLKLRNTWLMPTHSERAVYALLMTRVMLRTYSSARSAKTQDTTGALLCRASQGPPDTRRNYAHKKKNPPILQMSSLEFTFRKNLPRGAGESPVAVT